jgi:broad specificity phosphatase PhoE
MKHFELLSAQTLEIISKLKRDGIQKTGVIMRHSEKQFTTEPGMEPFMSLTDPGKEYAFDFGASLDSDLLPKLYSSTFGRCIETAYLIDKGFTQTHKKTLSHTRVSKILKPFYVNDVKKVSDQVDKEGNDAFLKQWFKKKLPDAVIMDPETTAAILSAFMIERIKELSDHEIAICISHDWNIFPIKEFLLHLLFKESGDVGYLEGIVYFQDHNTWYITSYQKAPVALDMDLINAVSFSE